MWGFTDPLSNTFIHRLYAHTMMYVKALAPQKTPKEISEAIVEEMEEAALLVEHGSNDLDNEQPNVIFETRETLFTPMELNRIHLGERYVEAAGDELQALADDFGLTNMENGSASLAKPTLHFEDTGV